jgi:hypothetical protein
MSTHYGRMIHEDDRTLFAALEAGGERVERVRHQV